MAYYSNGWKTNQDSVGVLSTNWLVMCGKNGGSVPNNILVDGIARGINPGGGGSSVLSINLFDTGNNGHWAFLELMIWNISLSDSDMLVVSTALQNSLHDQVCISVLFVISM